MMETVSKAEEICSILTQLITQGNFIVDMYLLNTRISPTVAGQHQMLNGRMIRT